MVAEGEGSSLIVTLTGSAHHDEQYESNSPSQYSQSLSERKQKDICFRCRKQGHWAQDCPSKTPTKASSSQPSTPEDIHHLPVLRCHCGVAYTISVSRSEANPGRRYYARNCSCDNAKATPGKNFFQWCDNVKALMCKCGAGACTINIQRDENGKDTKYYTCRIRTGHGSCGFLQFDGPPNSPNSWPRSMEKDKRPSILSPKHSEPPNTMTHEDECPIPSFSTRNKVVHEVETCDFVTGKRRRVSRLTSRSDIHSRQIMFWNQITAAGNSPNGGKSSVLVTGKVLQIMGVHVNGWVGRLAFPPPRILADPLPRHFFCCKYGSGHNMFVSSKSQVTTLALLCSRGLFPLFDPILVSEHVDSGSSSIKPRTSSNAEVDEVSQNALSNCTQLMGVPLVTSSLKRSYTATQEGVTNPILKEVGKNPQKDLLSLLKSMDPQFGPFAECLMKSIQCTSRVAQMDSTLQDNNNQKAPTIHKNIEKCLDNVSGIHAEAFATLLASSNYLQSFREIASRFKDMLSQMEKLETFLLDIAKDVGQSKRRMLATHEELTKALKLPEEEEEQIR